MLERKVLNELCLQAVEAATTAGVYIESQLHQYKEINKKEGGTSLASQVVTAVDLKSQEIILEILKPTLQKYNLGLLTEELKDDKSRLEKPYFWCIDPLDGTLPFTEGQSGYAVSIALIAYSGDPIIGVVFVPDKAECYTSIKGGEVMLNKEPFKLKQPAEKHILNIYFDRSIKKEEYFERLKLEFDAWSTDHKVNRINYHFDYGAVCNALGVMNSNLGCYFKLPKPQTGGGSIWDFAATRLFFDELGLCVSNYLGNKLHLNNEVSTFMNDTGVIYATDKELVHFVSTVNFGL